MNTTQWGVKFLLVAFVAVAELSLTTTISAESLHSVVESNEAQLSGANHQQVERVSRSCQETIYFEQGSVSVDRSYRTNANLLDRLSSFLKELKEGDPKSVARLKFTSYASPEGGELLNQKLTNDRASNVRKYLVDNNLLIDSLIEVESGGVAWGELRRLVAESDMEKRDEVLYIIDSVPAETWRRLKPTDRWMTLVDSRNAQFKRLDNGATYKYLMDNIYPNLRSTSMLTLFYDREIEVSRDNIFSEELPKIAAMPLLPIPTQVAQSEYPIVAESATERDQKELLFALKTNMLFDVMMAPNVEVEIPIGDRFSVSGEWMFPWWVTKRNSAALQLLSAQLEGRYWFCDRSKYAPLTGWFAGVYTYGGMYDIQMKDDGYQGEFFSAGFMGGFAHPINKSGSLRLEYELALGYMGSEYRYYEGKESNEFLVWQHDGDYKWFGPTKLEVNLSWFINWKFGGRQ